MQYFTLLTGRHILRIAIFAPYFSINSSTQEVFQEVKPFLTRSKMPRRLYQHQPALSLHEIQTINKRKRTLIDSLAVPSSVCFDLARLLVHFLWS
jgi:hypothetical protein